MEVKEIMMWFSICHNEEERQEALSYLRGLTEEIVLNKRSFTVKLYVNKHPLAPRKTGDTDVS